LKAQLETADKWKYVTDWHLYELEKPKPKLSIAKAL
jgi:hypothetical protein